MKKKVITKINRYSKSFDRVSKGESMKLCFIIHPNNAGTILDRIAHEIGRGFEEPIYHYGASDIPKADHYFVTHYSMLNQVMMQTNPAINKVTCFFTHDKGSLPSYLDSFNLCHAVVAENPEGRELLAKLGVREDILHFVPECADPNQFKPHARTDDGAILICGTNYVDGRKNPELIMKVFELFKGTDRRFEFIGDGWPHHGQKLPYANYPSKFARCSVYLSCSKLEGGGPNSLIEAMHANLVPVVSDTGNTREYIVDGYNGFIFGKDATPEQIAELIEAAYKVSIQNTTPYNDVWQTVREFTWQAYGLQMKEIITNDYSITTSHGEFGEIPSDEPIDPYSDN